MRKELLYQVQSSLAMDVYSIMGPSGAADITSTITFTGFRISSAQRHDRFVYCSTFSVERNRGKSKAKDESSLTVANSKGSGIEDHTYVQGTVIPDESCTDTCIYILFRLRGVHVFSIFPTFCYVYRNIVIPHSCFQTTANENF